MRYANNINDIKWCPETELNRRHADFQSAALPTELSGHSGKACLAWWAGDTSGARGCPEGFDRKTNQMRYHCWRGGGVSFTGFSSSTASAGIV